MKTIVLSLIIASACFSQIAVIPPPVPPVAKMTLEDQYHGRALNAELSNIQQQINEFAKQMHAQEKVAEQSALTEKVCKAAKLEVKDCQPNFDTGEVTKKPEPPKPPKTEPPPNTKESK